jgi:hypothetical protein
MRTSQTRLLGSTSLRLVPFGSLRFLGFARNDIASAHRLHFVPPGAR